MLESFNLWFKNWIAYNEGFLKKNLCPLEYFYFFMHLALYFAIFAFSFTSVDFGNKKLNKKGWVYSATFTQKMEFSIFVES